jgi:hypothetical protein
MGTPRARVRVRAGTGMTRTTSAKRRELRAKTRRRGKDGKKKPKLKERMYVGIVAEGGLNVKCIVTLSVTLGSLM